MSLLFNFFHGKKIKILMVCTANVCRSPMAHAMLREMVTTHGLDSKVHVESAGTHVPTRGLLPDRRTIAVLNRHNINSKQLKTRRFKDKDVELFDYILVMDNNNMDAIESQLGMKPENVQYLLTYAEGFNDVEVTDPYYGHPDDFNDLFDTVEQACKGLLLKIVKDHQLEIMP